MSGKKYADAAKKFDRDQLFTPGKALEDRGKHFLVDPGPVVGHTDKNAVVGALERGHYLGCGGRVNTRVCEQVRDDLVQAHGVSRHGHRGVRHVERPLVILPRRVRVADCIREHR